MRKGYWGKGLLFLVALIMLINILSLVKRVKPVVSHNSNSRIFYETEFQKDRYFSFAVKDWPKGGLRNKEKIGDLFNYVFSKIDINKPVELVGGANEFSPFLEDAYLSYAVTFWIEPGTMFDTKDYNDNNRFVSELEIEKKQFGEKYMIIDQKDFLDLGCQVKILAR